MGIGRLSARKGHLHLLPATVNNLLVPYIKSNLKSKTAIDNHTKMRRDAAVLIDYFIISLLIHCKSMKYKIGRNWMNSSFDSSLIRATKPTCSQSKYLKRTEELHGDDDEKWHLKLCRWRTFFFFFLSMDGLSEVPVQCQCMTLHDAGTLRVPWKYLLVHNFPRLLRSNSWRYNSSSSSVNVVILKEINEHFLRKSETG